MSPDAKITAQHWAAVQEGAARTGRTADREQWRLIRDVYVAPTDGEARALALGGMMGRCWREFLLIYVGLGLGSLLKADSTTPDDALTIEYLADHLWLIGSPETVTNKIMALYDETGGFGYLLMAPMTPAANAAIGSGTFVFSSTTCCPPARALRRRASIPWRRGRELRCACDRPF
jgi:alkanesulfonate monooxygenase SsuD/methylene tetrahydromethanopterin reductase-like flavin-dependent oxidoreductase (luciferase family)